MTAYEPIPAKPVRGPVRVAWWYARNALLFVRRGAVPARAGGTEAGRCQMAFGHIVED